LFIFCYYWNLPQLAEKKTLLVMDVVGRALSYYEIRLHMDKKIKRRIKILGMIIIFNGSRDGYDIQVRVLSPAS